MDTFDSHSLTAELLIPTGIQGVLLRSSAFEDVVHAISRSIESLAIAANVEWLHSPPVMAYSAVERQGYFRNFPHLAAAVTGVGVADDDKYVRLALVPAACYPIYPMLGAGVRTVHSGFTIGITATCHRREPSEDIWRMQSFRQKELVHFGSELEVEEFKHFGLAAMTSLIEDLGLRCRVADASDAFFGRLGSLLKDAQVSAGLKQEVLVRFDDGPEFACGSANLHRDTFTRLWNIGPIRETLHSCCIGFGLDRIAVALFAAHGKQPADWPRRVMRRLDGACRGQ